MLRNHFLLAPRFVWNFEFLEAPWRIVISSMARNLCSWFPKIPHFVRNDKEKKSNEQLSPFDREVSQTLSSKVGERSRRGRESSAVRQEQYPVIVLLCMWLLSQRSTGSGWWRLNDQIHMLTMNVINSLPFALNLSKDFILLPDWAQHSAGSLNSSAWVLQVVFHLRWPVSGPMPPLNCQFDTFRLPGKK